ncbi:MAG TPA: acetyl-CoA carboxylase carboxyltransferase subunit beta [Clostridiaceae bacterium]|nr:acetyl-CoA carboxylase carboxyltransferase subunit beta [Clostridiaceae bacterium]
MSEDLFRTFKKRRLTEVFWQKRTIHSEDKPIYSYQQIVSDDLWLKCPACQGIIFKASFEKANQVCPLCQKHYRLTSAERIELVVDEGSFVETDADLRSKNPLEFAGYDEKQQDIRESTGLSDAIITGKGTIGGYPAFIGVMDARYLMGSMGSVVGEKLCRLFENAGREHLPVITFAVSGGARMQEGMLSLMQMARTAAAVASFKAAGGFYLSVMTDPTTGGVTASFASLGDIILAEPDTLIGFAGRRVIEGTIAEQLPDGFQKAEFLKKHGFLDQIVSRANMKRTLAGWLAFLASPKALHSGGAGTAMPPLSQNSLKASERLERIHEKNRPVIDDYLGLVFDDAMEIHGDRRYADDPAMYAGAALLDGCGVFVLGHRKGRNITENTRVHFGMPHPEGYRKANRIMKLADRLGRPLVTFVDTPGAYCGVGAEERGQGEAIAACLSDLATLETPVFVIVTGEGGSGGALAIGVGNRIAMLENALYSVISPRGFASLLWKDPAREAEAADCLKITAEDLTAFGICDDVLPEPEDPNDAEWAGRMSAVIRTYLTNMLSAYDGRSGAAACEERARKLDRIAIFRESGGQNNG